MISISNKWQKISALGIDAKIPERLIRHVTLCNQFAFTWILIAIPFFYMFSSEVYALRLLGLLVLSHIVVLLLNKFHYYNISRIIEDVIPKIIIYLMGAMFIKPHTESVLAFVVLNLSFFATSYLIYEAKELKFLLFSIAVSLSLYLSFDAINELLYNPQSNQFFGSKFFENICYILSAVMIITSLAYLNKYSREHLDKIEALLKETRKQNFEIREQKEELQVQRNLAVMQRNEIETQKSEITSSINYARRIQETILPSSKLVSDVFGQSAFLFLKPKDIVSGDFFWLEKTEDSLLFAAVDCTGHGVPGAFISIVGYSILNHIVNELGIRKPSLILEALNKEMNSKLGSSGDDFNSLDTMDIAFCSLNLKTNELEFSGSNSVLLLVNNEESRLVKSDRIPLGVYANKLEAGFTNHEIKLNEDDTIYIFSDGFFDQFGGITEKRFTKKRFIQTLISINTLEMNEQRAHLADLFLDWRCGVEQTDDVLVFGMRI